MPKRLESNPKTSSSPEKNAEELVQAAVGTIDESSGESIDAAIERVRELMRENNGDDYIPRLGKKIIKKLNEAKKKSVTSQKPAAAPTLPDPELRGIEVGSENTLDLDQKSEEIKQKVPEKKDDALENKDLYYGKAVLTKVTSAVPVKGGSFKPGKKSSKSFKPLPSKTRLGSKLSKSAQTPVSIESKDNGKREVYKPAAKDINDGEKITNEKFDKLRGLVDKANSVGDLLQIAILNDRDIDDTHALFYRSGFDISRVLREYLYKIENAPFDKQISAAQDNHPEFIPIMFEIALARILGTTSEDLKAKKGDKLGSIEIQSSNRFPKDLTEELINEADSIEELIDIIGKTDGVHEVTNDKKYKDDPRDIERGFPPASRESLEVEQYTQDQLISIVARANTAKKDGKSPDKIVEIIRELPTGSGLRDKVADLLKVELVAYDPSGVGAERDKVNKEILSIKSLEELRQYIQNNQDIVSRLFYKNERGDSFNDLNKYLDQIINDHSVFVKKASSIVEPFRSAIARILKIDSLDIHPVSADRRYSRSEAKNDTSRRVLDVLKDGTSIEPFLEIHKDPLAVDRIYREEMVYLDACLDGTNAQIPLSGVGSVYFSHGLREKFDELMADPDNRELYRKWKEKCNKKKEESLSEGEKAILMAEKLASEHPSELRACKSFNDIIDFITRYEGQQMVLEDICYAFYLGRTPKYDLPQAFKDQITKIAASNKKSIEPVSVPPSQPPRPQVPFVPLAVKPNPVSSAIPPVPPAPRVKPVPKPKAKHRWGDIEKTTSAGYLNDGGDLVDAGKEAHTSLETEDPTLKPILNKLQTEGMALLNTIDSDPEMTSDAKKEIKKDVVGNMRIEKSDEDKIWEEEEKEAQVQLDDAREKYIEAQRANEEATKPRGFWDIPQYAKNIGRQLFGIKYETPEWKIARSDYETARKRLENAIANKLWTKEQQENGPIDSPKLRDESIIDESGAKIFFNPDERYARMMGNISKELVEKVALDEYSRLKDRFVEEAPAQDKSNFKKLVAWYRKERSLPHRIAINVALSTAAVGTVGVGASLLGFNVAFMGAGYLGTRAVRLAFGSLGGAAVGKAYKESVGKIANTFIEYRKKKKISNLESNYSLFSDTRAVETLEEIAERQKLWNMIGQAMATAVGGMSVSNVAGHIISGPSLAQAQIAPREVVPTPKATIPLPIVGSTSVPDDGYVALPEPVTSVGPVISGNVPVEVDSSSPDPYGFERDLTNFDGKDVPIEPDTNVITKGYTDEAAFRSGRDVILRDSTSVPKTDPLSLGEPEHAKTVTFEDKVEDLYKAHRVVRGDSAELSLKHILKDHAKELGFEGKNKEAWAVKQIEDYIKKNPVEGRAIRDAVTHNGDKVVLETQPDGSWKAHIEPKGGRRIIFNPEQNEVRTKVHKEETKVSVDDAPKARVRLAEPGHKSAVNLETGQHVETDQRQEVSSVRSLDVSENRTSTVWTSVSQSAFNSKVFGAYENQMKSIFKGGMASEHFQAVINEKAKAFFDNRNNVPQYVKRIGGGFTNKEYLSIKNIFEEGNRLKIKITPKMTVGDYLIEVTKKKVSGSYLIK